MPSSTKVPSLGSAVKDYTDGLTFLRAATPAVFSVAAALLYTGWAHQSVRVYCVAAGVLCAALTAIGVYGFVRISVWLPSVRAPAYALVRADGRALVPQSCSPWLRPAREIAALAALAPAERAGTRLRAVYSDRLGNRVFQYVFARLRAAHLCVDFEAPALGEPWGGASVSSADAVALRVSAADGAAALEGAIAARGGTGDGDAAAARVRFLQTPSSRYCMNAALFAPHDATIAAWLRPGLDAVVRAAPAAFAWGPADVAVHVRVGDILWGHHAAYRPLPLSFYRAALQRVPAYAAARGTAAAGRVVVVTEDASHALVQRLAGALRAEGHDASVRGGASAAEDLAALYTAPAVVLSVSTFAWWPAVLSRAARAIVVPRWGLLWTHEWEPSPSADPGRTLTHDMTVRSAVDAPRGAAVHVVDLAGLPCWAGNTADAWSTLFD
jgi:hypothetical protein